MRRASWALLALLATACGTSTGSIDAGPSDAPDAGEPLARLDCPIAIVGASASGVSAAIAATELGVNACLFEETDTIGGQLLVVPELDEAPPAGVGIVAPYSDSYRSIRRAVQRIVRDEIGVRDPATCDPGGDYLNPGACSCCTVCYEPATMARALDEALAPAIASGRLRIYRRTAVVSATRTGDRVIGVVVRDPEGTLFAVDSRVVIDATELGDVIPLAGIPYRTGAEAISDTGETHARDVADPECVQAMTFPIFIELRPDGEDHSIAEPPGYDRTLYEGRGPAVWASEGACGGPSAAVETTWRRMRSSVLLNVPTDISQVNTRNDFDRACLGGEPSGCNAIDKEPAERDAILARGREYAAGFLYYLQHHVPREDGSGGEGYPNLRPASEVSGTPDGVSLLPYARESRRIRALFTILEDDLSYPILRAENPAASRAHVFGDSVGLGHYILDLHRSAAGDPFSDEWHRQASVGDYENMISRTLPFQIPLGALIPETVDGFVAAGKNLGATHITNGAYRLHPTEWQIGIAAGVLAARAIEAGVEPRAIYGDRASMRSLQDTLVHGFGAPIYWFSDVAQDEPELFRATQLVAVEGIMLGAGELRFDPDASAERYVATIVLARLLGLSPSSRACPPTLFDDVLCTAPYRGWIETLVQADALDAGGVFRPEAIATRRELAVLFARALDLSGAPATPSFTDVPPTDPEYAAIEAASAAGLLAGDTAGGLFRPDEIVTRATLAIWSANVLIARYGIAP